MSNRNIIRFASFSLCFIAVITTYAIIGNVESRRYQAKLEATYQSSLTELAECLDMIETNLAKSAYASSPTMMAQLSEDLYSECNTAKNSLSHLPIDQMNLSGAYKFLSQAGDYSNYMTSKIRNGSEISDDEMKDFAYISKKLDEISLAIDSLNLWVDKTAGEQGLNLELLNAEKAKLK